MAMWKQWIVLFGGFYDLGVRSRSSNFDLARRVFSSISSSSSPSFFFNSPSANYLDDLWVFDTQEYKWKQVEFPLNFQKPSFVLPPHPFHPFLELF